MTNKKEPREFGRSKLGCEQKGNLRTNIPAQVVRYLGWEGGDHIVWVADKATDSVSVVRIRGGG